MSEQYPSDLRREVEALRRLAMITSATLNLDEMLTDAVRETAELLDCEGAQLWMPDPTTYRLLVHQPSVYGLAQMWPITSWPLNGLGHLVDAYHTGQPYTTNCASAEVGHDCVNLLVCPLNTRSRTLGVLRLLNRRTGDFGPAQIELTQAITSQIAVSLSSAQTFAAERRRTELLAQISQISQELSGELEAEALLEKAAQRIHEVFGQQAVHLLLLIAGSQEVCAAASAASADSLILPPERTLPANRGVIGRVIRSGQAEIVADMRDDPDYSVLDRERRLQSCVAVPLRRGDESIGAIIVLSTEQNAFGDLERDALEALAAQVNVSLDNAQLVHQIERRFREQAIVHQIGQDLVAILNTRQLTETIVQRMNAALNTSGCLVALCEPGRKSVRVAADYRAPHHHRGSEDKIIDHSLPLDQRHAIAQAINLRQPVTVYLDGPDARSHEHEHLEFLGDHSQLIMPLVAGNHVIGVVDWTDNQPGRRFSPDDIQLARTLVNQATVAIDNALLFEQLERRALELAEANRLRSQFLATITHELRTPMNSIIGFTETLIDGLYGALNDQQANRLQRIRQNAYNLMALIEDLLDLSRIDAGRLKLHLELVNPATAVLVALPPFESEALAKGLTLSANVPDDLPRIHADPDRLQQIITNLLSNAIKFTHEGGITVSAAPAELQGRSYVEIAVADTGIGISEQAQSFIFDEFRQEDGSSTRTYGGTGMGLAITRKLVQMMNGTICVDSEPGRGSTFTFALPVAREVFSDLG